MSLSPVARRSIAYLWQGPPSLPQALRMEWRFVAVRWVGIIFVGPGLVLAHLSNAGLRDAYAVLVLAALYNVGIQTVMRRRPTLFANGYLTAVGDALLNIAMIQIGGGFNSPFYYLLFTVTISAAMRYGYGPALATVLIVVGLDALETMLMARTLDATFVFRSGFLIITAALAGYLRAQAQVAEGALQERLRQAHVLNAATATLGVSLELEPVLQAVAAAARHLLGGECAVLQPSSVLDSAVGVALTAIHDLSPSTSSPAGTALRADLAALCRTPAGAETQTRDANALCHSKSLPDGRQALVLLLARPPRQTLATLAVSVPPGRRTPMLDPDILNSFVERTTLAIENASLYRALAGRTQDLQRAYGDLATAHQELLGVDEMKTGFLANVSHELRTPLTSIRSFSELLLSYDDDPAVQREFVQIINVESERLTRLVNDVLDISKIEAGQMDWHRTTVDVAEILHDSARPHARLIEQQGLVFVQAISPHLPRIVVDRDRLQQVITNLLNNALKFTPTGTITLNATYTGDEIRVAVADTGIGIAAEDHERIFEKFQQVGDTLTDKPRGTGLGLCICRDIVAYHDGRLWVESQPGVGSTFIITLPVAGAVSQTREDAASAA